MREKLVATYTYQNFCDHFLKINYYETLDKERRLIINGNILFAIMTPVGSGTTCLCPMRAVISVPKTRQAVNSPSWSW